MTSATRVQVVDFFSGCGGTSFGFQQAGLHIAAAVDHDRHAAATFRHNFPDVVFIQRDIRRLKTSTIRDVLTRGPVLFSGCAPCQPFSGQNQQPSPNDPRRTLLHEFQRFVTELLPEYVVVENVPGAQRVSNRGPFGDFIRALERAGYAVRSAVLRAGDFGVPQERRRLVIVAGRDRPLELPDAQGSFARTATVRDAIGHLPALDAGQIDPDDPDHAAMHLTPLNLERIRLTPEGGGRRDWPPELRLGCHERHDGHTDVYGRMSWDRAASGLTTRCLSYSNGRFGHPERDRAISAREAACLQTFPDTFRFFGPLTEKGRQIGNAVPPLFARRIAEAITLGDEETRQADAGR